MVYLFVLFIVSKVLLQWGKGFHTVVTVV